MMSSNTEGLGELENLVRRDRNHPSVFMWSLGNEDQMAATDAGLHILSAMKATVRKHDDSRPCTIPPPMGGSHLSHGGYSILDVQAITTPIPTAEAFHEANPEAPVMGTEQVSAVGYARDLRHGPRSWLREFLRSVNHESGALPAAKAGGPCLRRAAAAGRRVYLDGLRETRLRLV